jgi:hypothetical protein
MLLNADIFFSIGIVSCPYSDPTTQSCLDDTSWQSLPGWATSLNATFRRASMAYSRQNGTILTHQFIDKPASAASVDSSDILQAWDNFLGVSTAANDQSQELMSMLGLGGGGFLFPGLVSWFLNGVSAIALENPAADTRGVNALQALLAIPLYWCQTGIMERNSMVSLPSSELLANAGSLNITDGVRSGATISLAVQRNEIAVSVATLTAYVSMSVAALLLCFVALSIGMCTSKAKSIPKTSSFPALDFCTNCVVTSTDGIVTSRGPFQAIQNYEGISEKRVINQMHVELAQVDCQTANFVGTVYNQPIMQSVYPGTSQR